MPQLSLFGPEPEPDPKRRGRGRPIGPVAPPDEVVETAHRLPVHVRFGTSSWSFPGWAGLLYDRAATTTQLARGGLEAYSAHPLLRTVGVDRTYYAPVDEAQYHAWAEDVPEDFQFLVKAPDASVLPRFPDHPRHGEWAGRANPRFLDPAWAIDSTIGPMTAGLGRHAGPLVFQCSPMDLRALGGIDQTIDRLHSFLTALPKGPTYAVEVRNVMLLTPRYAEALRDAGAVHCFNVHPTMPDLGVQLERFQPAEGQPWVVRWLLRRGLGYDQAIARYEPFDRIVDSDDATRDDLAVLIAQRASVRNPAFVIVNNKAEGSAPRSILALAEAVTHVD